jgi:hypothetical protein
MNAPFANVAHGTPEALREFIHEQLSLAILYAQNGMGYAEAGDDVGLEYDLRRLAAYTRAALSAFADLKRHKTEGAHEHV